MENINLAKIAELAYLEIQESEKEKLAKKLEQVVEYVGKIKELDFATVSKENNTPEPTKSLRLHPDIPQKTEIDITALSNSAEDGCFKVPKVIKNFEN